MKIFAYLYHDVADDDTESGFQNPRAYDYTHRVSSFESNLGVILSSVHEALELKSSWSGQFLNSTKDQLLITFDDGGSSALSIADMLEKHGLRGYFFMVTSRIGHSRFLCGEGLRELERRGHIVGSHTHNHLCPFSRLSYKQMLDEWLRSKGILEDLLGREIVTGSIPGGAMNQDVFRSAGEAGLRVLFTSRPTRKLLKHDDLLIVGRLCPKNSTSEDVIRGYLEGNLNYRVLPWDLKSLARKIKYSLLNIEAKATGDSV